MPTNQNVPPLVEALIQNSLTFGLTGAICAGVWPRQAVPVQAPIAANRRTIPTIARRVTQ